MDPLKKAERLCVLALELPQECWAELLDVACDGDPELRRTMHSLFEGLAAHDDLLDKPLVSRQVSEKGSLDAPTPGDTEATPAGRVGSYRIEGVLGRGGMAVVYAARQQNPDRQVALKLLYPGPITPQMGRRFQREAMLMGRLQHPGIVQIFEAGMEDVPAPEGGLQRLPFIAMERVHGPRLDQYLKRDELSIPQRLGIFVQICNAVGHAHGRGVLHRDLKPANILLDENGHPKITDFGIARSLLSEDSSTPLTTTGQILGSLPYMSPEQLAGDPRRIDQRSDIYSLGVILYEILTGRRPFEVGHLAISEAAAVIATRDPPSLESVSGPFRGSLQDTVSKAMKKNPPDRYPTAGGLALAVRNELPS